MSSQWTQKNTMNCLRILKKDEGTLVFDRESNGHFLFCLFPSVSLSVPTLHCPLFLSPPMRLRQCDFVLFHVQRSPLQHYCRQLNSQKWSKQKMKCTKEKKTSLWCTLFIHVPWRYDRPKPICSAGPDWAINCGLKTHHPQGWKCEFLKYLYWAPCNSHRRLVGMYD